MQLSNIRHKCKRQSDYIITALITNQISLLLTWGLLKTPITPNQVTYMALLSRLTCGIFFSSGSFTTGAFFLFLSHILDCTDGNLARAKEIFSAFGRWIDFVGDKIADIILYISLSIYFLNSNESIYWIALPLLDSTLLMLYYYIVDIGLSLGLSKKKQEITSFQIKGVHIKWGLLEPVIYGFVLLAPLGFVKLQLVFVLFMTFIGFTYQGFKIYRQYLR